MEAREENITAEEALGMLKLGHEVMVKPYGDVYDSFVGITIDDFIGDNDTTDDEIVAYLNEKEDLQMWYYEE